MNILEAYILSCGNLKHTAERQEIAISTARRRLDNLGIGEDERFEFRQAATIGACAGRLFQELYARADNAKKVDDIRKTIVRDYPDLSANALRQLEANIRTAKSTRPVSRRKYELDMHLARARL